MNPVEVYQGHPGTTETTLYTVPAGQRLTITEIIISNTDVAATRNVTIHLRRGGVAAASSNRAISGIPLNASSVAIFKLFTVMAAGGIISGFISAASTISVTISGVLETI